MHDMSSGRSDFHFGESERRCADVLIDLALAEDLGKSGDVTTSLLIPAGAAGVGEFVARGPGVVAGLPVLERLLARFDLLSGWILRVSDGDAVDAGDSIARIVGPVRTLLTLERVLLNFLQRLSGIASLTARYATAVAGTRTKVLDTRKTTPGWRALEKYAVRCGGGANHRFGLYDAILIKDNHLAWLGSSAADPIAEAVRRAKMGVPDGGFVEIEVDTLEQFDRALACGPDIVLVDNLGPEALAEAVRRRDALAPSVLLESSGGVTLAKVRPLAETGVDRISIGALTHSAPALDIGLDLSTQDLDRR